MFASKNCLNAVKSSLLSSRSSKKKKLQHCTDTKVDKGMLIAKVPQITLLI